MPKMDWFEKLVVNSWLWKLVAKIYVKPVLNRINPRKLLEIGCGIGITTEILSEAFPSAKITAIDVDKEQIKLCSPRKNVSYYSMDATNITLKKSFDTVVILLTLHHVKEWEKVLLNVNKKLEPNGTVMILDLGFLYTKTIHQLASRKGIVHLNRDKVVNELRKLGFRIVEQKGNNIMFLIHAKNK